MHSPARPRRPMTGPRSIGDSRRATPSSASCTTGGIATSTWDFAGGATYANDAADVTFLLGNTTEFSAVLADTTILVALQGILPGQLATGTDAIYPAQTLFQLETLEEIAEAPGLNFVFAHLLLPHPPYAFNADGSRVTPEQRASRTEDEQYVEQLQFANARILRLLDRLQAGPPESWPIVVLAADEGPFPPRYAADEAGFAWLEATPEELLRKFSILTAVSVPGVDAADLAAAGFSDTMTPVNLNSGPSSTRRSTPGCRCCPTGTGSSSISAISTTSST